MISDIEEEIEDIEQGAETFRELALENKKKHMWENYKMIIIGSILIGIICIIALISIFNTSEEWYGLVKIISMTFLTLFLHSKFKRLFKC